MAVLRCALRPLSPWYLGFVFLPAAVIQYCIGTLLKSQGKIFTPCDNAHNIFLPRFFYVNIQLIICAFALLTLNRDRFTCIHCLLIYGQKSCCLGNIQVLHFLRPFLIQAISTAIPFSKDNAVCIREGRRIVHYIKGYNSISLTLNGYSLFGVQSQLRPLHLSKGAAAPPGFICMTQRHAPATLAQMLAITLGIGCKSTGFEAWKSAT